MHHDVIHIEVANQSKHSLETTRIISAARQVLEHAEIREATVSIAAVDAEKMHDLNRKHLQHDYPTDVLSFVFEHTERRLEGEIIVCLEIAAQVARDSNGSVEDELLLYVIHGALHLVGYDDHTADERAEMRKLEQQFLDAFDAKVAIDQEMQVDAAAPAAPTGPLAEGEPR